MKKICIITTIEVTLESFVIPAARYMKLNGWEVTLVASMNNRFQEKYQQEFHCINLPMERGISVIDCLKMPLVFYRLFRHNDFDIVQYATPNASLYASIGARLAGVKKRLYCQWGIRYVGNRGLMRRILKFLEKITCMNSTHIRPASWKNLDFAVSEGLYHREKAAAIGDGGTVGVDLSMYPVEKKFEFRSRIRDKYPALGDKIIFCFVGRVRRDKGAFELLDAFKNLSDEGCRVGLLMIGQEETIFPPAYEWVKGTTNIIFTGAVPHEQVCEYLAAADILVHPSYREGFSMVIQEAMAMTLPVITTDIPGPSEVIEENVTGILAQARDMSSLYNCMKWALDHPQECAEMGLRGRKRCEEHFNRDRMLKLTLRDREQILGS